MAGSKVTNVRISTSPHEIKQGIIKCAKKEVHMRNTYSHGQFSIRFLNLARGCILIQALQYMKQARDSRFESKHKNEFIHNMSA